jgi:hypothetical protein
VELVTDLAWADIDGDQKAELIATGEWMPVSIFKLSGGKLQNITAQSGLENSNGLWNKLEMADLDKDGDLDIVTGNLGLNLRFTASAEAPLRCYAKDFDNNNTLDPIVAFQEKGKIYPLVQKDVLVKQIPGLKKRFLYSDDYAKATISDIWAQKDLDGASQFVCYNLETCWWENSGRQVRQTQPATPGADIRQSGHRCCRCEFRTGIRILSWPGTSMALRWKQTAPMQETVPYCSATGKATSSGSTIR